MTLNQSDHCTIFHLIALYYYTNMSRLDNVAWDILCMKQIEKYIPCIWREENNIIIIYSYIIIYLKTMAWVLAHMLKYSFIQ